MSGPVAAGDDFPTDLELIGRYRATRDQVHVAALFERYAHLALGVGLRYLRNREDAEDAMMEVYERLVKSLLVHEVTNFKSWLHSVVANQCRMTLRRRKTVPGSVEVSDELLDAALASARVPRDDEDRLIDALPSALAQLAEGQRRCVELFYMEGLSYAEVAAHTGYAANEVKSHIQNGKRNLRKLLAPGAS